MGRPRSAARNNAVVQSASVESNATEGGGSLRRGYRSECGSALREVGVAARFGSRSFAFVFGPHSLPMKDFCRGRVWAGSSVAPLLLLLLLLLCFCFCFCFCSPPCHLLTSHSIFIYPDPALQRQENARARLDALPYPALRRAARR